jgi:hypothetical protein
VAETTVKRLLCCGFRRTDIAMGQVYQCWWRICWEIIFSPGSRSYVLRFISICDLFTVFLVLGGLVWCKKKEQWRKGGICIIKYKKKWGRSVRRNES